MLKITVLSQYMRDIRENWRYGKESSSKRKSGVKKILGIVNRESEYDCARQAPYAANTYMITPDTIKNTRDTLAEGEADTRVFRWRRDIRRKAFRTK